MNYLLIIYAFRLPKKYHKIKTLTHNQIALLLFKKKNKFPEKFLFHCLLLINDTANLIILHWAYATLEVN